MKHMIKKTMLTGALSCFLLGTALADDATNPACEALLAGHPSRCR